MIGTAIEPSTAFRVMTVLAGIWACVSGLEQLSMYQSSSPQGLMNWKVMKSYYRENHLSTLLEPVLRPSGFQMVLISRVVLGVVLLGAGIADVLHPAMFLLLFLTDAIIFYRNIVGLSGAYHMLLVVNAVLFLVTLFPEGSLVYHSALVFLGIQGVMAYAISGYLKLYHPEWRNGSGIQGIFATRTFGDDRIYRLFKRYPVTALVGSWTVILFECAYLFVLAVDPQLTVFFFATAIMFHAFNAVFIGLNGFLIIFPASYYGVYYTNVYLHDLLL